MQKSTKIIIAGAAAAFVLASAAGISQASDKYRNGHGFGHSGHDRHAVMAEIIDRIDGNGDGSITRTELDDLRKSEMGKHDANGDGKLTLEEFEGLWASYMRSQVVRSFQKLDRNGDAVVTQEEIAKPMNRMMSWMDRNNDDKLTKGEMRRKGKHRGWRQDDDDDD